ncbi:MAG TPA: lactate racemase domain-containing protein [Polyangiaceae bacterium]|nr:lactate racemase domain-containing protein [Polyangiaceae bacterium]
MSVDCFAERALRAAPGVRFERRSPETSGAALPLLPLCRSALAAPIGSPALGELASRASRVVVIVSDASRDEPREEMLAALMGTLPRERVTLVVAAGTHSATADVVPAAYRDLPIVVHQANRAERMVDVGITGEGTRIRLLREVATADLVVVTGRIRPHYFAGYSGGVKGLFPGCALAEDVLQNHLLKADPSARLGRVEDNRCRLDMEEAALRVPGVVVALNVLADCDGGPRAAAFGHPVLSHRELVRQARALFLVRAPRSRVVVVADRPPVTRSLYQASKLLPPAGAILEEGGSVIVVAECSEGIEPVARVNEGIYRLGVARSLPARHRVLLVSELPESTVRRSYAEYAPTVTRALEMAGVREGDAVPLLFRAGESIVEADVS